jgi:integrase
MNTISDGQDASIRVFLNDADVSGLKSGEPALFIQPSQKLLEEPTLFLRAHYVDSGKRSSPKTWAAAAYALQSWFEFLMALGVTDWRDATRDDLIAYRDGYATSISPKTGASYATGTIGNRMAVILAFHKFAGHRGWYTRDLLFEAQSEQAMARLPTDRGSFAPIRGNLRSVQMASDLVPRRRTSRTAIRPFSIPELRAVLLSAGPRASARGDNDRRPARDRLIFDFGWAVGLRLDEIHQLTKLAFLNLHPDPEAPACEQGLTVVGKGRKKRIVAVPNWLVIDALAYISGERKQILSASGFIGRRENPALFLSSLKSDRPGMPISHRRMQQIVGESCIRAGLVEGVDRSDPETGKVRTERKAKHCVHDLRHTYATLTYWAEKQQGNPEPWKKIQAQLGHEQLTTTINIYLHYTAIFGEKEGLVDVRKIIGL